MLEWFFYGGRRQTVDFSMPRLLRAAEETNQGQKLYRKALALVNQGRGRTGPYPLQASGPEQAGTVKTFSLGSALNAEPAFRAPDLV